MVCNQISQTTPVEKANAQVLAKVFTENRMVQTVGNKQEHKVLSEVNMNNTDTMKSPHRNIVRERQLATLQSLEQIHGKGIENKPAKDGAWNFLAENASADELLEYSEKSKKMKKAKQKAAKLKKKELSQNSGL